MGLKFIIPWYISEYENIGGCLNKNFDHCIMTLRQTLKNSILIFLKENNNFYPQIS